MRRPIFCAALLLAASSALAQDTVPEGVEPPANDIGLPSLREILPQTGAPSSPQQRPMDPMPLALLQGLDKITARTSTFMARVGETTRFGQLEVTLRSCRKAPPIEPPESAAFLDIRELRPDEGPVDLFRGWMFASSPALSAMEHPVYDVWVVDCRNEDSSSASPDAQ